MDYNRLVKIDEEIEHLDRVFSVINNGFHKNWEDINERIEAKIEFYLEYESNIVDYKYKPIIIRSGTSDELQNCSAQWFFNLLKKRKQELLDEKKLILNKDFNLKNICKKILYNFKNLTGLK